MEDSKKIKMLIEVLKEYAKLENWMGDHDKSFYINVWIKGNGYDSARKVLKEINEDKV